MPKLLILSDRAEEYENLIRAANLPDLEIFAFTNADVEAQVANQCEIVLGSPSRIRDNLPSLTKLLWVQTISAGIELLLVPGLRRDYILTNARGVFGELMSEYVFGYLKKKGVDINALIQALVSYKLTENQSVSKASDWINRDEVLNEFGLESFNKKTLYSAKNVLFGNWIFISTALSKRHRNFFRALSFKYTA